MSAPAAAGRAGADPGLADRAGFCANPASLLPAVEYLAGTTPRPPRPRRHHLPPPLPGLLGHSAVRVATGQPPPTRLSPPRGRDPRVEQPQPAPGHSSGHAAGA